MLSWRRRSDIQEDDGEGAGQLSHSPPSRDDNAPISTTPGRRLSLPLPTPKEEGGGGINDDREVDSYQDVLSSPLASPPSFSQQEEATSEAGAIDTQQTAGKDGARDTQCNFLDAVRRGDSQKVGLTRAEGGREAWLSLMLPPPCSPLAHLPVRRSVRCWTTTPASSLRYAR